MADMLRVVVERFFGGVVKLNVGDESKLSHVAECLNSGTDNDHVDDPD